MRAIVVGVTAMLLIGTAMVSRAETKLDVAAENNRAIELSKAGKLGDAIKIWFRLLDGTPASYEHRWVFHKNVGRNFQKLSSLPQAWWHLSRCLKLATKTQKKPTQWRDEVAQALKADGYVRVTLSAGPSIFEVRPVTGEYGNWYQGPTTWWFKPGNVKLPIRLKDGTTIEKDIFVPDETASIIIELPRPAETGLLILEVKQASAEIFLGGNSVGFGRAELKVEEGDHHIEVKLDGFETWSKKVGILMDDRIVENVVLLPKTAGNDKPDPSIGTTRPKDKGKPRIATWKWVILGSSVVLIGAGAGTYWGWAASELEDAESAHETWIAEQTKAGNAPDGAAKDADWDDRYSSNVLAPEVISYVLWGLGGAGAIASVVLIIHEASTSKSTAKSSTLGHFNMAPTYHPGGGGFSLDFTF